MSVYELWWNIVYSEERLSKSKDLHIYPWPLTGSHYKLTGLAKLDIAIALDKAYISLFFSKSYGSVVNMFSIATLFNKWYVFAAQWC